MWKIIIGYGLLILGLGDCPLEYYPSETVLGIAVFLCRVY